MHLYTTLFLFLFKALGKKKNILLVIQFHVHSASIFCKGEMVTDVVSCAWPEWWFSWDAKSSHSVDPSHRISLSKPPNMF